MGDPQDSLNQTVLRMAKELHSRAQSSGEMQCLFNGIIIVAGKETTFDEIVSGYHESHERRRQRAEEELGRLMRMLPELDFGKVGAILTWVEAFQIPASYLKPEQSQEVVKIFEAQGYRQYEHCAGKNEAGERANFIIEQMLVCLRRGDVVLDQQIPTLINYWRKDFPAECP
jgi:hypothetical protein